MKVKKLKNNELLSIEEKEIYEKRILELKDLSIIAMRNKEYKLLQEYAKEISEIQILLKKAIKNAKKKGL